MNWNYVGTGLALVAIGLTLLLAPLPPSWWSTMPRGLIQATFGVGLVLSLAGLIFVIAGISPVLKDHSLWPQTAMVVGLTIFVIGLLWYFLAGEVGLPGFGVYSYIRLYDTPELRRHVIYDFAIPQGGEIKFFLSASDQFNFSVSDVNKETYSLDIPLTSIPINRFIFLFCDVGLKDDETIMRVTVDDQEVGSRILPFRINLGDATKLKKGVIGADINGQNNAPFKIAEIGVFHTTLTSKQKSLLMDKLRAYLKNTNSPLSSGGTPQ